MESWPEEAPRWGETEARREEESPRGRTDSAAWPGVGIGAGAGEAEKEDGGSRCCSHHD